MQTLVHKRHQHIHMIRCKFVHTKSHPGVKLETTQWLQTASLNVKFTSVLEGALKSITIGSIVEIINISLNFYVLNLSHFVIHFLTLCNDDVMDCTL